MIAEQETTLSAPAAELLAFLQRHAYKREFALTDRHIAGEMGIPVREVIDLADELIRAGHLVIAETSPPHGRWLCVPMGDLAAARAYANSLGRRAIKVFRRRKHLRAAIAAAELSRPVGSTGQHRLFDN